MAGLGKAGVRGIALFPEGLRHPFGLEQPLMGPGDYDGEADPDAGPRRPRRRCSRRSARASATRRRTRAHHAALESSYFLEPGGTATGNVTFYPKVNSLVIGDEVFDGLDDAQRKVLAQAAAQTREWAIEESPTDADAAEAFCADGRRVVLASEQQVAALERAAAPVTAELESDGQTASIIEAIRALKGDVPDAKPSGCGQAPDASARSSKFDGVYRFRITDEQLRKAGITDAADIDENHGRFDVTLDGGTYCWVQQAPNPLDNPDECSTYEVDGDRVVFSYPERQARRLPVHEDGGPRPRSGRRQGRQARRPPVHGGLGRQHVEADRRRRVAAVSAPRRRAGCRRRGAFHRPAGSSA